MNDRTQAISVERGDERDAAIIAKALGAHVAAFGLRDEHGLTIVARDRSGAVVGGVTGASHWRWLYIRQFWIASDQRGGGLGRRLLSFVEDEARTRDCIGLYLDTFDPGAEAFYERCGFERCGAIDDFPPGHTRRFLRKRL